jgi:hypothetical protein
MLKRFPSAIPVQESNEWSCHCCTAKNDAEAVKCRVCGRPESYALQGYALPFHGNNYNLYRASQALTVLEDIHEVDAEGWSSLHSACAYGNAEIVIKLLEFKAKIEARTNKGQTPLHLAAYSGSFDCVKALLKHKAQVNVVTEHEKVTPLHIACQHGFGTITALLVEHGADIEAKNILQRTALHFAAEGGRVDIGKLLLSSGAKRNALDVHGWNARQVAELHNHRDFQELIIREGMTEKQLIIKELPVAEWHSTLWSDVTRMYAERTREAEIMQIEAKMDQQMVADALAKKKQDRLDLIRSERQQQRSEYLEQKDHARQMKEKLDAKWESYFLPETPEEEEGAMLPLHPNPNHHHGHGNGHGHINSHHHGHIKSGVSTTNNSRRNSRGGGAEDAFALSITATGTTGAAGVAGAATHHSPAVSHPHSRSPIRGVQGNAAAAASGAAGASAAGSVGQDVLYLHQPHYSKALHSNLLAIAAAYATGTHVPQIYPHHTEVLSATTTDGGTNTPASTTTSAAAAAEANYYAGNPIWHVTERPSCSRPHSRPTSHGDTTTTTNTITPTPTTTSAAVLTATGTSTGTTTTTTTTTGTTTDSTSDPSASIVPTTASVVSLHRSEGIAAVAGAREDCPGAADANGKDALKKVPVAGASSLSSGNSTPSLRKIQRGNSGITFAPILDSTGPSNGYGGTSGGTGPISARSGAGAGAGAGADAGPATPGSVGGHTSTPASPVSPASFSFSPYSTGTSAASPAAGAAFAAVGGVAGGGAGIAEYSRGSSGRWGQQDAAAAAATTTTSGNGGGGGMGIGSRGNSSRWGSTALAFAEDAGGAASEAMALEQHHIGLLSRAGTGGFVAPMGLGFTGSSSRASSSSTLVSGGRNALK